MPEKFEKKRFVFNSWPLDTLISLKNVFENTLKVLRVYT